MSSMSAMQETIGVWIALGSLLISAATLVWGAIGMNNKARVGYVDILNKELGLLRGRLEDMGKEHETLKRDLAVCVANCDTKDHRIDELVRENHALLLRIAYGQRMHDLGKPDDPPPQN